MSITIEKQRDLCIWTEAGVLNGKICDRGFRCEDCPLDTALRDSDTSCQEEDPLLELQDLDVSLDMDLPEEISDLLHPFSKLQICEELRYSRSHVWVRRLKNGKVKCGLDAFAAALLPVDAQLIVVANNTRVREGEHFGWVYGGSHTIPLSAPISGTVSCRNTGLLASIESTRTSPYQKGCVVTMEPDVGALADAQLVTPAAQARNIQQQVRELSQHIADAAALPDVGICLNDGGTQVKSLSNLFGEDAYWQLISRFVGG
ncbi:MAG: hypothetical protein C0600_03895 [Ignavibacteria bacterium]|nr:MAG: hypothetical protein C0600_03895 [Ignavibacteria bacterium]